MPWEFTVNDSTPDAKLIFLEAIEKVSPEERARYLEEACMVGSELRDRVDALLQAHDNAGKFLGGAATTGGSVDQAVTEGPGTVVGPYKLLEQIGEGGFGVVYMAEQTQPVRRKVAFKILKPGMDSRQIVARFEAERQALAIMDHPNIAKVLDGGATSTGRPYFVMDLVKGVPITEFCDQNHLTPRQRLELFVPICQAVQHAHQKGIIHRDLKPSNVLVTVHDTTPVPKIIDFGVAKALGQELTEKTLFTGFAQMIGTPMYMSPEQAGQSGMDVDTRSDIYSLGVLLYELLTGSTPFSKERFSRAAYDEIRRIIREEEPPRPSTRLSALGRIRLTPGDAATSQAERTSSLATVSELRQTEPAKLTKLMRGELDWIVMKALEKDRNRRFETASGLGADVQRYLRDEPVQACPPSAWYRLRKLVRRHRGEVLAASSLILALIVGIFGTTWGMLRATDAEAHAVREANLKERALNEKGVALAAAQRSKRDADEKLFASYLDQSRALRVSHRAGQRFETLDVLRRATALARTLHLPDEQVHELRNAVIATLALPDLHLTGPWNPWPADAFTSDFDEAHAIYARTDRKGNCSVRRVTDDVELHRLPGNGVPASVRVSRDGKFLAVAHFVDGPGGRPIAVQLWELGPTTARMIRSEEKGRFSDFHCNARQVGIAYADGTIRLFELPSGRPLGQPLPPVTLTREVQIAIHPTEPVVAVCSYFGSVVQLRDVNSAKVLASLPQDSRPGSVAWHPDGRTLAVGLVEAHQIRLYDRATLQVFRTLEVDQNASFLSFNQAGDRLASSGWREFVELLDVGTGQKLFATGRASGGGLRFSPDGRRIAGSIQDGKLGVFLVGDGRDCRTLVRKDMPESAFYSYSMSIDPSGRLLAVAMTDGFGIWDLAGGAELGFIPTGGAFNLVLFEPSGALLQLGPRGLFRWPIAKKSSTAGQWVMGPPERLPLPCGEALGQSRDGRVIVTCDRAIGTEQAYAGGWILHADRPDPPIHLDPGADIVFTAVSPDGRWVVTVTHGVGLAKIWDARDGRFVKLLAEYGAGCPHFSPDGNWLSTDLDGGRLFAVDTWEPGPRVGGAGTFTRDGKLMALWPTRGAARLVDAATGRQLAAIEDPNTDGAYYAIFSPDDTKLIASSSQPKGLRVWDLRLIRQELKEMGLDWDAPKLRPARELGDPHAALSIKVITGTSHYDRGVELARKRKLDEAVEELRLAIQLDPNGAAAYDDLGSVLYDQKKLDEAILAYKRSIELEPIRATAHNNLGCAMRTQGRLVEAIAYFKKAVELAPRYAQAHLNLGLALQAQGNLGEAIASFKKCTEIEPTSAVHANRLAWLLVTCREPEFRNPAESIALATRAVDLAPQNGSYWNTLGVARYRAGDWKAAIEALEKARTLQGDAHLSLDGFFLAMSHGRLGNEQDARKWYTEAIKWMEEREPQNEELKHFRAEAEALLGVDKKN